MRDGKEVEVHTWSGPDDPENPYALPNNVELTNLTYQGSIGRSRISGFSL